MHRCLSQLAVLLCTTVFLGLLESGVSPMFMMVVGQFYKKDEQALRMGLVCSIDIIKSLANLLFPLELGGRPQDTSLLFHLSSTYVLQNSRTNLCNPCPSSLLERTRVYGRYLLLTQYGLGHITGSLSPWQYIYIVAGIITILWSAVILFFMPPDPIHGRNLNERERTTRASGTSTSRRNNFMSCSSI
jgi:MFS family permease